MDDRQLKRIADKLLADILDNTEKARQHGAEATELSLDDYPDGYDFGGTTGFHVLNATLSRERTGVRLDLAARVIENRVKQLRNELRLGNYGEHTRRVAKRRAEAEGIPTPPATWFLPPGYELEYEEAGTRSTWDDRPSIEFAAVLRVVAQTLLEGYEIELERINGVYGTDKQVKAETRLMQAAKSYTLNDLWKSYEGRHKTEDAWAGTTEEKYTTTFIPALHRLLGEDYDFSTFEEPDRATELIQKLKEYKSSRTNKTWSAATVNDCIVFLSGLYNYAIENRNLYGITYNPFRKRQVAETAKKKEAFTSEELKQIWGGLQTLKAKGVTDKYWVMLLMLYTGARIGEVCQLRIDDVEQLDGRLVIHYRHRPELGQTIKAAKRKQLKRPDEEVDRITALHPDLKALGFLRYVEKLKERGEVQVFPEEKRTGDRSGVLMAKKMTTFLNQCGIKGKSSHHCRHTFVTWYKQNCNLTHTEASLISAMVGHEDDYFSGGTKITWQTYGGKHLVKQMYDVIKKLNYGLGMLKEEK